MTNERKVYFPTEDVLQELDQFLEENQEQEIDWITIVGSGEPTLHTDIGRIVSGIKQRTAIPVAVITNGSLLHLAEVRMSLCIADAVLPSLDAGNPEMFRRINRPHPGVLYLQYVDGLREFKRYYKGEFLVEVMLMGGINDSLDELEAINQILKSVDPTGIHINIPTRPPAETWVQAPGEDGIQLAKSIFGPKMRVLYPGRGMLGMGETTPEVDSIVEIISRHPLSDDELRLMLERSCPSNPDSVLADLKQKKLIQQVERNNRLFWIAGGAAFLPDTPSINMHGQH